MHNKQHSKPQKSQKIAAIAAFGQSGKELVDFFLPKVSRTFAMTIQVLPAADYLAVGLAYLICRILDSLEDTLGLADFNKVLLLRQFARLYKQNKPAEAYRSWLRMLEKKKKPNPADTNDLLSFEYDLLHHSDKVIAAYRQLPSHYSQAFKAPILQMALGMANFVEKYQDKKIKQLSTDAELDQYCYIVAGTVGQLLSNLFIHKIHSDTQATKILQQHSQDFAFALQRINILKDFLKDKNRKWIYIPKSMLKKHSLSQKDFLNHRSLDKLKALQLDMLAKTEEFSAKAIVYLKALPLHCFRYRLFCYLPLVIAIRTTKLLKKAEFGHPSKPYRHKIKRMEIRLILISAPLFVLHNWLLNFGIFLARKL